MIKIHINKILKSIDKSIYWLADEANLSYPTVYNLVNNKTRSVHFDTLEEIMKALDINSFDDILEILPDE